MVAETFVSRRAKYLSSENMLCRVSITVLSQLGVLAICMANVLCFLYVWVSLLLQRKYIFIGILIISCMLEEKVGTFLYSSAPISDRNRAHRHLCHFLGHPDVGSDFERKMSKMKYVFRIPFVGVRYTPSALEKFMQHNYDVLLLDLDTKVKGHTAFQIHPDCSMRLFSVFVAQQLRGNGYAMDMVTNCIMHARKQGLKRVHIGGGNSDATNHIYAKVCAGNYGVVDAKNNWVELV